MELKTYQARSMSDALAKVKNDLGKGAMILHTRTIRRGGILGLGARTLVEITATNDARLIAARAAGQGTQTPRARDAALPPEAAPSATALAANAAYRESRPPQHAAHPATPVAMRAEPGPAVPSAAGDSPTAPLDLRQDLQAIRSMVRELLESNDAARPADVPAELIDYYTKFIGHEVARGLVMEILDRVRRRTGTGTRVQDTEASEVATDNIREELLRYVGESLPPSEPLRLVNENRPTIVALVGPTGVGKTTTLAKLAAHMKLREGRSVGLITIDSYRIAAVEQLKTYAQIMQIPIIPVVSTQEMTAAIRQLASVDLILIDTAGRSQKDDPRIAELKDFLEAAAPDQVHLVLSTTASEAAIRQAIEKFSSLGAGHLIFTKLDEAVGFGVILNVLRSFDLRLSYITTGQAVPDDIEVGSARRVVEMILGPSDSSSASPPPQRGVDHGALQGGIAARKGV